jgi:hypothetical protein
VVLNMSVFALVIMVQAPTQDMDISIMDISAFWPTIRPFVSTQIQNLLHVAAGGLAVHGAITASQEGSFVEMGTSIALWGITALYGWWTDVGQRQLVAAMAKMKPVAPMSASTAEAVKAAVEATKAPAA